MSETSRELTAQEALALLPETERIHTQMESGFTLLGADWDRADVEQLLRDAEWICTTIGMAKAMGKGLVCRDSKGRRIFIEAGADEQQ